MSLTPSVKVSGISHGYSNVPNIQEDSFVAVRIEDDTKENKSNDVLEVQLQWEELNNNWNDNQEESHASQIKDSSVKKVNIGLKQKVTKMLENRSRELEVMKRNVENIRDLQRLLDLSKEEIARLEEENRNLDEENSNVLIDNKKLKDENRRAEEKREKLKDESKRAEEK